MKEDKLNATYRIQTIIVAAVIPVLVLVLWQIQYVRGVLNTNILASPKAVVTKFQEMLATGELWKNILASAARVVKGYLIGAFLGFFLGALNGLFKSVNRALVAVIAIMRPVPPIALIPFLILWLGIGEASKITIIAIGSFWPVLLNTMQGIQDTDPKLLEVASAFGKNRVVVLFQIILPSAVPSIFTGLRLGISQAWTCVVTAEMIAASAGVGYVIQYARELVQPDLLLVGIITIGIIGLLIDLIVIFLQKKIVYWRASE